MQGLDAYSDKQIAGASGTGQPSFTAEMPVLLEEAVLAHVDNFNVQLQSHFDDMFANGREIVLELKHGVHGILIWKAKILGTMNLAPLLKNGYPKIQCRVDLVLQMSLKI